MRILHISDTHGDDIIFQQLLEKNKPVDLLIHSGDVLNQGVYDAFLLKDLANFFEKYPAKEKIFVPGNHDIIFDNTFDFGKNEDEYILLSMEYLKTKIYNTSNVLINEGLSLEGLKIWGTPYQPYFNGWGFNCKKEKLQKQHAKIPEDTNILITHAPPYGILDIDNHSTHCGDQVLAERIKSFKNLKACFYGHIHNNLAEKTINSTLYKNSAIASNNTFNLKTNKELDFLFVDI